MSASSAMSTAVPKASIPAGEESTSLDSIGEEVLQLIPAAPPAKGVGKT